MEFDEEDLSGVPIRAYSTVVKPALMYGSETWAIRQRKEAKLERTEMRMLRWMMGISLLKDWKMMKEEEWQA